MCEATYFDHIAAEYALMASVSLDAKSLRAKSGARDGLRRPRTASSAISQPGRYERAGTRSRATRSL